jgi:acyl-coenzyme A thioesterase PaaI-like protein
MAKKRANALQRLLRFMPENKQATLMLRLFGFTKIPLLLYVRPSVVEISEKKVVVKIPLRRRTKNHLRSMYFGALAIGADCSGGLMAMRLIEESPHNIALVFKTLSAEFLKRAEGDVYFTCEEGDAIAELVNEAALSSERVESPIHVVATVPGKLGNEPVAKFTLILSIKKRSS